MSDTKRYLGDGVYVDYDNNVGLVLTTEHGLSTIYLEPLVWGALKDYALQLEREHKAEDAGDTAE